MSVISRLFFNKCLAKCRNQNVDVCRRTFSLSIVRNNDSNIVRCTYSDAVIPDATIPEILFSSVATYHKYIAIECAITGKKYNFEQVRTKSCNLGKALKKQLKLNKGDVVAVLLPNCPDFLISALGIMSGGLVITSINNLYTSDEIAKQLLDSGAKAIIAQAPYCNTIKQSFVLMKKNISLIAVKEKEADSIPEGVINFQELINLQINDMPDIEQGNGSDLAFLPYSSGTTGLPKGVLLSHYNLASSMFEALHPKFNIFQFPEGDDQCIVPMVLPMYHIFGFSVVVLANTYMGAKTVTLPKFLPDTFIDMLKKYPVTHLFAVTPLILFMTSSSDVKPEYLRSLRVATSGAAPLGYSDELRFKEKIKNDNAFIRQGYGLTETAPVATMTPAGMTVAAQNEGNVGQVAPNTMIKIIAIDDVTGTPLGPNEKGELLIKGPQVTKGYHNKPEETKNAFLEGWLRTGDMAYYNDDKFFFLTDRLKELIKVKGFQVPPAELEAIIRTFPAVEDAAVIGIPHPAYGEVPRAYVVVKKNQTFNSAALQSFVNDKAAKYKHLVGGVQILESIPKNPSGKILRRQLKEQYEEKGI